MALKLIYVVVVAATHTPPCHARPYANPVHSFKWIAGIRSRCLRLTASVRLPYLGPPALARGGRRGRPRCRHHHGKNNKLGW